MGRAFEHGTKPAQAREARARHDTKKYGLGPGTTRKNMGLGQARHDTGLARHDKPEGTTRKHEQTSPKARHDKKPDILTLIIIINFYLSIINKLK